VAAHDVGELADRVAARSAPAAAAPEHVLGEGGGHVGAARDGERRRRGRPRAAPANATRAATAPSPSAAGAAPPGSANRSASDSKVERAVVVSSRSGVGGIVLVVGGDAGGAQDERAQLLRLERLADERDAERLEAARRASLPSVETTITGRAAVSGAARRRRSISSPSMHGHVDVEQDEVDPSARGWPRARRRRRPPRGARRAARR
jgi:hypothetical protein